MLDTYRNTIDNCLDEFKKQGRSATYSDQAIECCLTIKALFQFPLRQPIVLLESLFSLAKLSSAV